MTTREHLQRALGLLLLVAGVAFRVLHFSDFGNGSVFMTFGFFFSLLPYYTYTRRLKAENEELRHQLSKAH